MAETKLLLWPNKQIFHVSQCRKSVFFLQKPYMKEINAQNTIQIPYYCVILQISPEPGRFIFLKKNTPKFQFSVRHLLFPFQDDWYQLISIPFISRPRTCFHTPMGFYLIDKGLSEVILTLTFRSGSPVVPDHLIICRTYSL